MASTALDTHIPDTIAADLSRDEQIWALHKQGLTQTAIGQYLKVSQSQVSRTLSKYRDSREEAKAVLHNGAKALAERILKNASVEESLEVLDRLDVAPKKRDDKSSMGVQVIVMQPGQTQLQPPVIQVNEISNYQTQDPQIGCGNEG